MCSWRFWLASGCYSSWIAAVAPAISSSIVLASVSVLSRLADGGELVAFIIFAVLVLVINVVLSVRVYSIKREISVLILALGVLLLTMSIIVSNALLVLR